MDIDSIVSINEQINKILHEQNKTLSEINQDTINNNKKIKSITSHHLF